MLIVDTAAGIGESVLQFCQAAQQVLVVLRDEPASLTDTYALIKVLSRDRGVRHFRVVANMTRERGQGQIAVSPPAARDRSLSRRGARLRRRNSGRHLVAEGRAARSARCSRRFRACPAARPSSNWRARPVAGRCRQGPSGGIEFFFERMLARPRTGRLQVLK